MQRDKTDVYIGQVHPDETEALLRLYVDLSHDREPLTQCIGMSKERIESDARKCLHVSAVEVAPGYEGAGIATTLLQTALEQAAAREFTHVVSERTSMGSRRCHEKLGFQCLHTVAAGEVTVDGVRPFAQNPLDIFLLWKELSGSAG